MYNRVNNKQLMLLNEKEQEFLFCVDKECDDEAVQTIKQSTFGTHKHPVMFQ